MLLSLYSYSRGHCIGWAAKAAESTQEAQGQSLLEGLALADCRHHLIVVTLRLCSHPTRPTFVLKHKASCALHIVVLMAAVAPTLSLHEGMI